jgi:hypothetical protein
VKNEVQHTVKEQRSIIHTIKRGKANWIGHILHRDCLLELVIEGKLREKDGGDGKTRKKV